MSSNSHSTTPDLGATRLHLASLLDLSSRVAEADPLEILNVGVLSIMGRLRVFRACVLMPVDGAFVADPRLLKGVRVAPLPEFAVDAVGALEAGRLEHRPLIEAGLERIVPLLATSGLVGVLCLGPTMAPDEHPEETQVYLELASTILGTTVHNAEMVHSLVQTSKELETRALMIRSLFETARDFTGAKTRDELLRILSYRLMGQLMVSTFGLYLVEPLDGALVVVNRREADDMADVYDHVMQITTPIRTSDLAADSPLRQQLESADIAMASPMTVHGVIKGVLATRGKLNGQDFTTEECSFLEAIGTTAMTAIENERLIQEELIKQRLESELNIAAEIQKGLFPRSLPDLPGLEIAASSRTSRVIGGDYYDVIRLDDDRTLVAIADVAGKGIPAALLMANVQAALKVLAKSDLPLTSLIEQINSLVCENTEPEVFITMFLCVVNTRTLDIEYVNAGHNPPIVLSENNVMLLSTGGVLTGVLEDPPPYLLGKTTLKVGDLLVLYTDGVTEARKGMEEFGLESLQALLRSIQGSSSQHIVEEVQGAVEAFSDSTGLDDDTTLIVIKAVDA